MEIFKRYVWQGLAKSSNFVELNTDMWNHPYFHICLQDQCLNLGFGTRRFVFTWKA